MKPLIFVSHIHAHRDVVKVLTDEIHKLLPNAVKFFVSSDGQSIPGGDDWLDAIEDAIKRAAIALIICTEESVGRPWIQFEAGGAWFAGKRVVPLCFGAMTPERLPQPLASRQAFSAADPKDLEALVSLIAKQAELEAPPFNAPGLAEKLANALSMAPTRAAVDPDSQGETPAEPTPPTADTPTELSVRDDVYKPLHTGLKALLADLTETPYPTQILYDQEDSLGAKHSYRIWHDMVEAGQASRLDAIGQQSLRARLDALAEPVDAYNAVMKTAHRVIRTYLRQGHSDYAPSGSESDEKNGWDYPEIRHELIDNEAHEFHKWGGYDSPTADFVNSSGGGYWFAGPESTVNRLREEIDDAHPGVLDDIAERRLAVIQGAEGLAEALRLAIRRASRP